MYLNIPDIIIHYIYIPDTENRPISWKYKCSCGGYGYKKSQYINVLVIGTPNTKIKT